jgi:hypothetical protein
MLHSCSSEWLWSFFVSNWLAWSRLRQKVAIFCQTKRIQHFLGLR